MASHVQQSYTLARPEVAARRSRQMVFLQIEMMSKQLVPQQKDSRLCNAQGRR